MKKVLGLALATALAFGLSGCASKDDLAKQFRAGDNKNYIAGDGSVTVYAKADRPVGSDWTSTTATGTKLASTELAGHVVVLNFWYAGCAPCRVETPDLQKLQDKYAAQGLKVVGVDVRDSAETALAFMRNRDISYPTVMDGESGDVIFAFTGIVNPSAVPTTIVIDRNGKVMARIFGRFVPSTLNTLVRQALEEK